MNDLLDNIEEKQKRATATTIDYDRRKKIEKMVTAGLSYNFIAEMIGVHFTTIGKELKRCPPGKYTADEAQKDVDHRKRQGKENKNTDYEERISSLEMQVQILCEKIEELNVK